MAGSPRERARARTMAEITQIGRDHLTKYGAAALSVRAVARDLGVVSSAIYRYVKSRDDLLTLLVVEAYDELGDEVDAALALAPADDARARFQAICWAVRAWALREPARYALLFGSPVPGYHAPREQTVGPGTRVIGALIAVYQQAWASGAVTLPATVTVPPALRANFDAIRSSFDIDTPDPLIARGVLVWAALFAVVNFEVFEQYGPTTFGDLEALFAHHLDVLTETLGFPL
ncbi:TetR family transcriptional regulator [Nocardia sp. SYP-A9097]|uniref:TetR/AcrR family transcriptional regulator n=1 Tax=Nocardia sp. SYP-A9097 TaxID=2663237 RepID=UPI00129A71C7|nr:TetR-like C-terminal domain-containing protein [Nocardia sp. SYP-A9097]MRH92325.1 TetR family transcriptional regulator [Nocardia sp. SYP-A9097]